MTLLEQETYVFDFLQSNPSGAGVGDWTKAEVDRYLRAAELDLFTAIVDKHEYFFTTTTTLNEVGGAATINLPTNCYKVLKIERLIGLGTSSAFPSELEKVDRNRWAIDEARGWNRFPISGMVDYPMHYFMHGQKIIELVPAPANSSTGSLRLTYVYRPAAMSAPTDVPFQISAGSGGAGLDNLEEYHEILPLKALEKCLVKEESFAQADRIRGERMKREGDLIRFLTEMSESRSRRITVTDDE